jgi:hypothetical protein
MQDDKHRFNLKGKQAEGAIFAIAQETFFTDWCYTNPKLPDGKELCDLLVVFDNVVVIWQIKDLKLHEGDLYNPNDKQKNLRQLGGARRLLFDIRRPVKLVNPRRGTEEFDPTLIKEVYLISVLMGTGESKYSITERSGDTFAHIFPSAFVETLLYELDTIVDFVSYLRETEKLYEQSIDLIIQGGEEELLAYYILNGRSLKALYGKSLVHFEYGSWDLVQTNKEYVTKKDLDNISYFWDDLINRAHTANEPEYEVVARELARTSRFERRILSKSFYEAKVHAHEIDHTNFARRIVDFNKRTYCFLFCPDKTVLQRRDLLTDLCFIARGELSNFTIVGIATENVMQPRASYDMAVLWLPTWTDKDAMDANLLKQKTGFLVKAVTTQKHENEYPSQ